MTNSTSFRQMGIQYGPLVKLINLIFCLTWYLQANIGVHIELLVRIIEGLVQSPTARARVCTGTSFL